jgi:hypothetical protein
MTGLDCNTPILEPHSFCVTNNWNKYLMNFKDQNMQEKQPEARARDKKPDDLGNIQIDCHIKIYDPKTQQVLLETRA